MGIKLFFPLQPLFTVLRIHLITLRANFEPGHVQFELGNTGVTEVLKEAGLAEYRGVGKTTLEGCVCFAFWSSIDIRFSCMHTEV